MARKYTKKVENAGWFGKGNIPNNSEENARKSKLYSGEGNPYYGKKHTAEIRRKMQRPKGVVHLGMTAQEYEQKLKDGFRWCIGHQDFLAAAQFSLRGYRNGIHRRGARCKVCIRAAWLMKAYRVTPEWYDAKLKEQGGHCALCPITEVEEGRPLSVDHDHGTGAARGILCTRCNSAMERMEINGWHERALAYLKQYSSLIT